MSEKRVSVVPDLSRYPVEVRTAVCAGYYFGVQGEPVQTALRVANLGYMDGWVQGLNSGFASIIDPITTAHRLLSRNAHERAEYGGSYGNRRRAAVPTFLAIRGLHRDDVRFLDDE